MRSKKTILIFFLFFVCVLISLSISGAILKHHYSQDKRVEKISNFKKITCSISRATIQLKKQEVFLKTIM